MSTVQTLYYTGAGTATGSSDALYSTPVSNLAVSNYLLTPAIAFGIGDLACLCLDATQQNIIYTYWNGGNGGKGQVRKYNIAGGTDSQLWDGTGASDDALLNICLEPGGATVLCSDRWFGHGANTGLGHGALWRVNLTTGAATSLGNFHLPEGIAYDGNGHLFITTQEVDGSHVHQIDPTTGASLASSAPNAAGFVCLCFDAVSGWLWAGADGGHLYAYDPATLTLQKTANGGTAIAEVASAGDGYIYFFEGFLGIGRYNIAGNSFTFPYVTGTAGGFFGEQGLALFVVSAPLSGNCNSPGAAIVGVPYTAGPTGSGGVAPYTYSIIAGALPPGLTINPSTGAITGIPRNTGTYSFTVQITDSSSATVSIGCSITASGRFVGASAASFLIRKLAVALKRDPHLPVRGAN